MPFDPCREWLGIDATDLKDPHRVLAIPPTLTDGDEIARIAEERLTKLAGIVPGPFTKAHAALMSRVAEARDTLLATATWGNTLDEAEVPSAEPASSLPAPPAPPPLSPPSPPIWLTPSVPTEDDEPVLPVVPPTAASTPVWTSPPARASQSGSGGAALGLFAIFLAVAIAGGYYAYKRLGVQQRGWDVALRSVIDPHAEPQVPDPVEATPIPDPSHHAPDTSDHPSDPAPTSQEPAAPPSDAGEPRAAMPQPATVPPPPPPPLDPEAERRMAAERARAVTFVNAALEDAFQSLQREEFDEADRAIEEASREVGDDVESATRVERWRLAAAYARAYVGYRDKAFRSAASGREYEIDGKRIVVIEVTPSTFVYRLSGRNVSVARKTMSPVLEVGVVEHWFGADGRAANYLFLGTKWLCKSPPNHTRARAAWQKAADGGENVAPLMALLDDPITQVPDGP
jgi:hypothetical protein